jgi:hypothetical protein
MKQKIHKTLTLEVILDAVERRNRTLDNPAFCIACGLENNGEPDMRKGACEGCGEKQVYGAEELLQEVGGI